MLRFDHRERETVKITGDLNAARTTSFCLYIVDAVVNKFIFTNFPIFFHFNIQCLCHIAIVWHQSKTLRQSETLGNAAGDGVELLAQTLQLLNNLVNLSCSSLFSPSQSSAFTWRLPRSELKPEDREALKLADQNLIPVLWKLIDEITNLEKSTFLPKPARYSESVMLPEKFSNFKFYAVMFSLN